MPTRDLWASALSLVLRHDLTGCAFAARRAADLLARIAEHSNFDPETRSLCEEASTRLIDRHAEVA